MATRKKKTIDDIVWEEMEIDGQMERVCSATDAGVYLGVSGAAGVNILKRTNIERHKRGYGVKLYVRKRDLDELKRGRPAE